MKKITNAANAFKLDGEYTKEDLKEKRNELLKKCAHPSKDGTINLKKAIKINNDYHTLDVHLYIKEIFKNLNNNYFKDINLEEKKIYNLGKSALFYRKNPDNHSMVSLLLTSLKAERDILKTSLEVSKTVIEAEKYYEEFKERTQLTLQDFARQILLENNCSGDFETFEETPELFKISSVHDFMIILYNLIEEEQKQKPKHL